MKPVLFITPDRARALLVRLYNLDKVKITLRDLSYLSDSVVSELLQSRLNELSKDGSHEESECKK